MDDSSLEFTSAYHTIYKDKFNQNADKFFSDLVEKSQVNVEANRQTAAEYRERQEEADDLAKKLNGKKTLRTWLVVLAIVAIIAAVVCIFVAVNAYDSGVLIGTIIGAVVGAGAFVACIVVICVKINPAIKQLSGDQSEREKEAQNLRQKAMSQLSSLFALYDNYCTFRLIEQTVPLWKFDRNFNVKRYATFLEKYGMDVDADVNQSTVDVFSGEIKGNPFFLHKDFSMEMGTQTYHGTLVISWTETRYDSKGNRQTVVRHQTLHASVTKPKPFFNYFTRLIYANDAAPDLSFSRSPSHAEKLSPKELESKIKSGSKKIQKMAARAMKDGNNFTEMGNAEFDVLFNALDRDNEVQFRLLFTPLAQKNLLQLMKNPNPYGDDFVFIKRKRVNYVASDHSQVWDYSVNTSLFVSYDIDLCRQQFLDYNNGFFRSLYFEFAPLMSIPLYQQHKPVEYIYQHEYQSNHTMMEAEVLANRLDKKLLCHPDTKTAAVLSAHILEKQAGEDRVIINANSFDAQSRTDYVPVFGGDGRFHNVPVHWVEYIPLTNQTVISVSEIPLEQDTLRDVCAGDYATRHGLKGSIINEQ